MSESTNRIRNATGGFVGELFGQGAVIGTASIMLLALSGFATWSGMSDFILGVSQTPGLSTRDVPGGLSVSNELIVIAVVVALTFLMWIALRETFRRKEPWSKRMVTLPLYIFLALWSVGFGYGFWWSLIAGGEATRTSLAGLQEDARDAGSAIAARIDAVKTQLDSVVAWSDGQMSREESSGGSCGVNSGAGRGPLYNARRSVRDSVATLRTSVVDGWIGPVQSDLSRLRESASELSGNTVAERQRAFERKASDVRGRARAIAARSNAFGQSTAIEMRAIADAISVPPGSAGFSCYDPTLAQRLIAASEQAVRPIVLTLREAEFNEGPAGVANAVKDLWGNLGGYVGGFVTSAFSGFADPIAPEGARPLTGRDLIALLATIGIDLGLFVLAVLRPLPPARRDREALYGTAAKLKLPPPAVIRQLAKAISTAISRAPDADLEWVRMHFIHHGGASFFVVPNLFGAAEDAREEKRALAMNQLAGVFDDVDLIRLLTPEELEEFALDEVRFSKSDLTRYRREMMEREGIKESDLTDEERELVNADPIRNHGLISKANRVLQIAGWKANERHGRNNFDLEIYRLVDTEGLTPLLTLLNEGAIDSNGEEAARMVEEMERDRVAREAVPQLASPPQRQALEGSSAGSPDPVRNG